MSTDPKPASAIPTPTPRLDRIVEGVVLSDTPKIENFSDDVEFDDIAATPQEQATCDKCVCYHHVSDRVLVAATTQDLCGYCSKQIDGRSVCDECWRERTSTLENAVTEKLAELVRLEKLVLASDGWMCDSCRHVFGEDDMNHGEDCDLCDSCASVTRAEDSTPMLTEVDAGEVIANSSESCAPIQHERRESVSARSRKAIEEMRRDNERIARGGEIR
jgi:hypothetical protein